jgi:hypothetical protein
MFPDVDTPFVDTEDVVRRLLPYHVLQQPVKDLQEVIYDPSGKGKARAAHKNEVDIEGGRLPTSATSLATDGQPRHQVDDRIPQKGPFTSPTVPTSESEVFAGTEHQFLGQNQAFLNSYSACPLKIKHMCSRMRFWIRNGTK